MYNCLITTLSIKITKFAVDQFQYGSALPSIKLKVTPKLPHRELNDLELTFKGMRDDTSLVITSYKLQSVQGIKYIIHLFSLRILGYITYLILCRSICPVFPNHTA